MNGARGLGCRGLPPVVAMLCLVGPVAASPPMGRLEVTVLDDVTGTPLVCNPLVQVVGGEYNVQVNTDFNGLAVFDPIPVGNYTVTVRPADPYFWARQTVSVGAKPPPTQITIRVERGEPTPYVEIMEPEGTVGNTVAVKYRFYLNDFHWLTRVRIEAIPDGHAAPTQEISDLPAGQLGNSTPVGTATLSDGVTPVEIRERSVEWDTTGLYNAAYTLRVTAWYDDPWDPGGDDIDGTDERGVAVRNLCFGAVTTSANNPDYFLFDAKAGSGFDHPTITFEFKDEGQTSNEQGPYTHEWAVWAVATNSTDPQEDYEAAVYGERVEPGTVTVYFNDLAAQMANDQSQIGDLVTWGSFTFEILLQEEQTGDSYWFRWPYDLSIPNTIPGTSTPGHEIYWAAGPDETAALGYDYFLQDNAERDASWFQVDCYAPDLASQGSVNNSTHVGVHHQGNLGSEITIFKANPYLMVFRAVDNHGSDGPAWCHREHENKRMLARNGREPGSIEAVTWETLPGTDNLPLEENPGNGMGGSHIGLRIFPGKKTATDPPALAQTRATVLVRVRTAVPFANVVIKAFDVDDPSIHVGPIDQEQTWPAQANEDNRDGSSPAFGFDDSDEIHVKTGANGEATADFIVGQRPGDNYRVVACLQHDFGTTVLRAKPEDAEARVVDLGPGGTGPGDEVPSTGPPSKYRASGVLTVWQRVFYEYDRMAAAGTYLAEDAQNGASEIVVQGALETGTRVALLDLAGHLQTGIEVADCQLEGTNYRVSFAPALQHDFLVGQGSYAAVYTGDDFHASLMEADSSLLQAAFEVAYVQFQVAASSQTAVPLLTQITLYQGVDLPYLTRWFDHASTKANVIWLVGGSHSVEQQYVLFGASFESQNTAVVFSRTIREYLQGLEPLVPAVIREVTVEEVAHQFGLLDWDDRQALAEECIGGGDGDVMNNDRVPGPPAPNNPNRRDNGIARFGPTNIGGQPPCIRGCEFPL